MPLFVQYANPGSARPPAQRATTSDHTEIRTAQSEPRCQRGKLGGAAGCVAVGVEDHRAGDVVVDDAVVGVYGSGANSERRCRQYADWQSRKDRVVKLNQIVGHVEVGNGVDVGSPKGSIEAEDVRTGETCQRVVAGAAVDDVVGGIAGDAVVEFVAGEIEHDGTRRTGRAQQLDGLRGRERIAGNGNDRVAALAGSLNDLVGGSLHKVAVVAGKAAHRINARAPIDHVIGRIAQDHIDQIVAATIDRIGSQ